MASAGLVVGLFAAIVVGVILIICCIRSIFRDKEHIVRQIKQVRGVNDLDMDDIEASAPPSEEHAADKKEYELSQQQQDEHVYGKESGLPDDHRNTAFADAHLMQPMEADGS